MEDFAIFRVITSEDFGSGQRTEPIIPGSNLIFISGRMLISAIHLYQGPASKAYRDLSQCSGTDNIMQLAGN